MYQSNTIRQCLWLITTIRQNERLTLKALQEKWTADKMGDTLYRSTANYLRTLPLHHSQRVADVTDDYTDFMLDIRPTPDFIAESTTKWIVFGKRVSGTTKKTRPFCKNIFVHRITMPDKRKIVLDTNCRHSSAARKWVCRIGQPLFQSSPDWRRPWWRQIRGLRLCSKCNLYCLKQILIWKNNYSYSLWFCYHW